MLLHKEFYSRDFLFLTEDEFIEFILFYHRTHYDVFYRKKITSGYHDRLNSFIDIDNTKFFISEVFRELPIV